MKTFTFLILFCFLWINTLAQFPQAIKYQAVVRDASGMIMENKAVSFKISILSGSSTGMVAYRENHSGKTTNSFGLVDLEIGRGIPETGSFSAVDWSSGSYYIKVEIFPAGATEWQEMGTIQLLSVPYALYAKDVQNKNDADADATNEIQLLSVAGNNLSLSKGGGTVAIPGDNWGTQVLKTNNTLTGQGTDANPLGVVNTVITPSWANIRDLPAGFADGVDNVNSADTSSTNEIQTLSLIGTQLTLSKDGGIVNLPSGDNWGTQIVRTFATLIGQGTEENPLGVSNAFIAPPWENIQNIPVGFADGVDNTEDADADASNEIQILSKSGNIVSLSKGGGSFTDAVDDADADPANELQELQLNGTVLGLTKSTKTVILPSSGGGDNWGTDVVHTDTAFTGNGTATKPLKIAQQAALTGQVLKWDGISWKPAADDFGDADTSITNEIQTLSLSGTQLTLSKNGGTVTLTSTGGGDNWGTQVVKTNATLTGQGDEASPLGVVNSAIQPSWNNIQSVPAGFADGIDNVNSADTSSTNEIQTISLVGNQLSLSKDGGTVTLPSGVGGDNWGFQVVNTNSTLTGQGTFTDLLGVNNAVITPSWANVQNIPAGFADGVDNVGDADADPTNEIQVLSLSSNQLTISGSNGNTVAFTNWDTDESNDVRLNGNQIISGKKTFLDTISVNNLTVTKDPVNAHDVANKAYVDALLKRISELESQPGIVKDMDGNLYTTKKIGNQVWMVENMKTNRYNDGTAIPLITGNTEWALMTSPGYCWYNNDQSGYGNTYGALYNWYAVNSGKLCPAGWHVPNDADWTVLSDYLTYNGYGYLGSGSEIAKSLAAKTNWNSYAVAGTPGNDQVSNNSSGFSGLPGGYRSSTGNFGGIGGLGYWWSSTEFSAQNSWYRFLNSNVKTFLRNNDGKVFGFSIRCIRD